MVRVVLFFVFCFLLSPLEAQRPRVIVLTDAETDDRCSMVHFLLYTNDMQVDGIIQTNSCFQKRGWSHEPWLKPTKRCIRT